MTLKIHLYRPTMLHPSAQCRQQLKSIANSRQLLLRPLSRCDCEDPSPRLLPKIKKAGRRVRPSSPFPAFSYGRSGLGAGNGAGRSGVLAPVRLMICTCISHPELKMSAVPLQRSIVIPKR